MWPGGNAVPPFTTEFARIVLELYPQWLADSGIPVPAEYLEHMLEAAHWAPSGSRPALAQA